MAGFPATPTRDHLGPRYQDRLPVRDPTRELGADAVNLAFWQLAGAGRTVPKAVLAFAVAFDGESAYVPRVTYQGLAWDPDGALPRFVVTRASAGVYTFTFAATYADERGVQVEFLPAFALPTVTSQPDYGFAARVVLGRTVEVRAFDAAGDPADADMAVAVWG